MVCIVLYNEVFFLEKLLLCQLHSSGTQPGSVHKQVKTALPSPRFKQLAQSPRITLCGNHATYNTPRKESGTQS